MSPAWYEDPIALLHAWLMGVLTGWGLAPATAEVMLIILGAGTICLLAMLFVIFLIWYERKLIGRIQDRFGPNRVGPYGIFQPFADMLKIFTKEYITPKGADWFAFNFAPVLSVASVLLVWAVIPFTISVVGVNMNVGLLIILGAGGFSLLALILAGYGSNNKYALVGGYRAVAQLAAYEAPMVLALLVPVLLSGSLGVGDIVTTQKIPYIILAPVAAVVFFITAVAESGRAPFDLVEGESELVAGFNVEYSGLKFGMFFVAEFLHAVTISLLFATFFLGGWHGPFVDRVPLLGFVYLLIKTFAVYFLVILFRGSLPRFRIDQVLNFAWKALTPLVLLSLVITALIANPLAGLPLLQALALFGANALLFVAFMGWVRRKLSRQRPIIAADRPLAVANPPTEEALKT